jgi:hypothetical protein
MNNSTTLQDGLDTVGPRCGAAPSIIVNNLDIICNQSAATTLAATVLVDAISGSTDKRVRMIGVNSDFEDDGTQIEITTNADLTATGALFKIGATSVHLNFQNIDFNGGGKDSDLAGYCVTDTETSDRNAYYNCHFHGAESHGVLLEGDNGHFVGCEFNLNGGSGYASGGFDGADTRLLSCISHHNDSHGFLINDATRNTLSGCIAYRNLGTGFRIQGGGSDDTVLFGCVAYFNTSDGFYLEGAAIGLLVINCTSSSSVSGYGYNFDSSTSAVRSFSNNHGYDNEGNGSTITHCSVVLDTAWAGFMFGSNIDGNPLFTNVTDNSEDFRPTSSSPLIDAGAGGTGDTIGALCATAGGGAGGGVMPMTGLLS